MSRAALFSLLIFCSACPGAGRSGLAPSSMPQAGGTQARRAQPVAAVAPVATPVARDVLLSISLPRGERDLTWLSRRLQAPLPAGPLRRFFGPAGLRRLLLALLGNAQLARPLDLSQPAALALVDRPGRKLRLREQFVLTVALRDPAAFLQGLASRYGERRGEVGAYRFGKHGPAVRVVGRRAYVAPSPALLLGAETILTPLLRKDGAEAAKLVLWSRRIRRRFGPSVDTALRWLRRRGASGPLRWLEPARRRAWELLEALWAGRVARLVMRFDTQRVVLSGEVEGGRTPSRAQLPLWGAKLLGDNLAGAFFVAQTLQGAEGGLRRALSLLPAEQRAAIEARARALGAHLQGPALGAIYGTKAGTTGLLWAARVHHVAAARRAQRALSAALPRLVAAAWSQSRRRSPLLRGLRRRPILSRRPLALAGGRGAVFGATLAWRSRLDSATRRRRAGWDAWWGRARPELAHAVIDEARGGFFIVAVGPGAGAKLIEVVRRAKVREKRAGRFARRWSARLGTRPVRASFRVSLTRSVEQLLSLMARRQSGPVPWGALLRQSLPPVGADQPAALTAWVGGEGQRLRFAIELSADTVGWLTKVGLLLFRVGSYGARGGKAQPVTP